jgi:SAM-dependent methyltransferase
MARSFERIKYHYHVERELADRVRQAAPADRRRMYGQVYDELFARVPDHPQLARKWSAEEQSARLEPQLKLLARFLDSSSRFLEIGAGDCSLSTRIAPRVSKCYALDVSPAIVSNAQLEPNMEVLLSDGCDIPLSEGSVTVAYSYQVIEHMHPDDAVEHLRNVYKVLAPDGVYICVTPNRLNGPHDVSQYFDPKAMGFHMKEYTVMELRGLFKKAGFRTTTPYVGVRNRYYAISTILLGVLEGALSALPFSLGCKAARLKGISNLLFISMAVRK